MYADNMTGSIKRAMSESNRRRKIQIEFNKKHHITPRSIQKANKEGIEDMEESEQFTISLQAKIMKNMKSGNISLTWN